MKLFYKIMFGNVEAELSLEQIDFEWVQKTKKISQLKKALKLLEMDGNYYTELIAAI